MSVTYLWKLHEHLKTYNRIVITFVTQVHGEKHKKIAFPNQFSLKQGLVDTKEIEIFSTIKLKNHDIMNKLHH